MKKKDFEYSWAAKILFPEDKNIFCEKTNGLVIKKECLYRIGQIKKDDNTCLQCPINIDQLREFLNLDNLLRTKKSQEAFIQRIQQKIPKKEGLKWLQEIKNSLPSLIEEYLNDVAKDSIFSGFIQVFNLTEIMASEEVYGKSLPILWEFHERHNRSGIEIQAENLRDRAFAWHRLLMWWTGIWGSPLARQLNLYRRDSFTTGELRKLGQWGDSLNDNDLVKIEEFREYLKDLGKTFKTDLPLPKRLLPPIQEIIEGNEIGGETEKLTPFKFSDDFRCIRKNGKDYSLTNTQAGVIEALYNAYRAGTPEISEYHILERAGSKSERSGALKAIFKRNKEAFNNLIMPGKRKGLYRLKP